MENTKRQEQLNQVKNFLFFAAITIEVFVMLAEKMRIPMESPGMIFRVTFALVLCSMIGSRYNREDWVLLILFAAIGFLSWRISGRNDILRMTIFVASMKGKPMQKAMRYTLFLTAAGCAGILFLSLTGLYGDFRMIENTSGRGVEVRYTLGFGHPNSLHCMAAMLLLFFLYLYGRKLTNAQFALLTVANGILYYLTKSESGFLIALLGTVLSFLFARRPELKTKDAVYYLGEAAFAAGLLFSLLAAAFGRRLSWIRWLDDHILTGRVASLWDSARGQGVMSSWTLFSVREYDRYFDMGFVRLVYWYGVIPAVMILVLLFLVYRAIRREKDAAGLVFLLCCCLYTVLEAHLVSIFMLRNDVLFLIGLYAGSLLIKETHETDS